MSVLLYRRRSAISVKIEWRKQFDFPAKAGVKKARNRSRKIQNSNKHKAQLRTTFQKLSRRKKKRKPSKTFHKLSRRKKRETSK